MLLHFKTDKKNCDILHLLPHIHFFLSGVGGGGSVVIVVIVAAAINTRPWHRKDSEGKPCPFIKL
jgi:hypothetical protein